MIRHPPSSTLFPSTTLSRSPAPAPPSAAYRPSPPPHPDSGSSGCAPTQTTVRRAAPDSACADTTGSAFAATMAGPTAANDCFTKVRRVRARSFMALVWRMRPHEIWVRSPDFGATSSAETPGIPLPYARWVLRLPHPQSHRHRLARSPAGRLPGPAAIVAVAELSMIVWLLVKGAKVQPLEARPTGR